MDRPVEFTKHALERITERGASRGFVVGMVTGGVDAVSRVSLKTPDIFTLTAKDGAGKYWTVIYTENRVLTVRRAHKKEERRYDEEYR